jgi:pantothenate kinase
MYLPPDLDQIAAQISARRTNDRRFIVAIAGAPASGKSTLADRLHHQMGGNEAGVAVVPMDGFHFDDAILDARGWRPRKGAPHTFDVGGLLRILQAIRVDDGKDIYAPVFDRYLEVSRGSARLISPDHRIILVEGNYLLLDQTPWDDLADLFDVTVFLDVPVETLEQRLLQRWLDHGFDGDTARERALSNDIPNVRLVQHHSRAADIVIRDPAA